MKKLLIISFLIISANAYSQIEWSNYSTSFGKMGDQPSLGVAIPYNGVYNNTTRNIVGYAHWNPQYKIQIDPDLNDSIPLNFVYDTSVIYFLISQVNKKNADEFEYTILLNNQIVITPWTHIGQFTQTEIGGMKTGSGITGGYTANLGEYIVAHLRNKTGKIISSWVVFWQHQSPEISLLYTSNNPLEFSKILNNKDFFTDGPEEIGWHRQYNNVSGGQNKVLKLPYNENSILLNIDAKVYKKEALEYSLVSGEKIIRDWGPNEFDNRYVLLKNIDPGDYTIRIRFKRQRGSITEFHFSISSIWYKTVAFKAAIFALLALAVVCFIFLLKYRNQKNTLMRINKKAEQSAGELQNIYALLNPHFTFNALSSIQGLVNKGNIDAANKYLSSFGELLGETLNESRTELISLDKELKNMKTYIGLEQLRYPFIYHPDIDRNIDVFSSTIPPFLLQPFVENAIKHSFSKMNGQGILNISISKEEDKMMVNITDNGEGFDTFLLKEGYGLSLSKKRIELLNRNYGEELIRLKIESTDTGTVILLSFKNWL